MSNGSGGSTTKEVIISYKTVVDKANAAAMTSIAKSARDAQTQATKAAEDRAKHDSKIELQSLIEREKRAKQSAQMEIKEADRAWQEKVKLGAKWSAAIDKQAADSTRKQMQLGAQLAREQDKQIRDRERGEDRLRLAIERRHERQKMEAVIGGRQTFFGALRAGKGVAEGAIALGMGGGEGGKLDQVLQKILEVQSAYDVLSSSTALAGLAGTRFGRGAYIAGRRAIGAGGRAISRVAAGAAGTAAGVLGAGALAAEGGYLGYQAIQNVASGKPIPEGSPGGMMGSALFNVSRGLGNFIGFHGLAGSALQQEYQSRSGLERAQRMQPQRQESLRAVAAEAERRRQIEAGVVQNLEKEVSKLREISNIQKTIQSQRMQTLLGGQNIRQGRLDTANARLEEFGAMDPRAQAEAREIMGRFKAGGIAEMQPGDLDVVNRFGSDKDRAAISARNRAIGAANLPGVAGEAADAAASIRAGQASIRESSPLFKEGSTGRGSFTSNINVSLNIERSAEREAERVKKIIKMILEEQAKAATPYEKEMKAEIDRQTKEAMGRH